MTPKLRSPEAAELVCRANELGKIPAASRFDFVTTDLKKDIEKVENIRNFPGKPCFNQDKCIKYEDPNLIVSETLKSATIDKTN